ncbi:unnamed protein product, partial [Discosporangium mesarthrocarpum]
QVYLLWHANETLRFLYEVQVGDSSADLDYLSAAALDLNGGFLYRDSIDPTTNASLVLPEPGEAGSLSYNEDIVVRSTTANVINVDSSTVDGEYGAGEHIYINYHILTPIIFHRWWDDEVTPVELLGGTAELWLKMGWRVWSTVHGAINGSSNIEGHGLTPDDVGKDFRVGTLERTVVNVTGNEINLSAPYWGVDVLEGVPAVNVSSTGYQAATYVSGNGTANIIFLYVVQPGDHTVNLEYWDEFALKTEGSIRRVADQGSMPANITLPEPGTCTTFKGCSLGANRNITVGTAAPTVLNMTTTKPASQGPYGLGDVVDITVHFSLPVEVLANVSGTPRLRMDTNSFADYYSGSGTDALTFLYVVQEGDETADLDAWDAPAHGELSALDVVNDGNTGYIRRVSTAPVTDADLALPSPGSSGSLSAPASPLVLDTSVPRVTAVNSTLVDDTYGVGQEVPIVLTFSGAVTVNRTASGNPYVLLDSGGHAAYTGGSGTPELSFLYVVGEGHSSRHLDVDVYASDVTGTTVLMLNGSAVLDDSTGASAVVTLPKPGVEGSLGQSSDIIVETNTSIVTNVTTLVRDGKYGVGHEVVILVAFDTPVTVKGVPRLMLELGKDDGYATYQGMHSNLTDTLEFSYWIVEGDYSSDLDYTSPFALELPVNTSAGDGNRTSILRDSTRPSQNVSLTLPVNGRPGSLGFNSDIWVETTRASVDRVSTLAGDGAARGIAGIEQTLDVHGSPALTSGGFRLTYGTTAGSGVGGFSTSCIAANGTGLNASAVEFALESANTFLNVSVQEDDAPFGQRARRFVVSFLQPTLGVKELGVDFEGCDELECGGSGQEGCVDSGVVINRDMSRGIHEGIIEVVVHFTSDIHVNTTQGSPALLLVVDPSWSNVSTTNSSSFSNTSAVMIDNGLRVAVHSPGRTQFVDVGVDASREVTQGHFRLQYGDEVTGCMDINAPESTAGGYSVKSRLEELDEVGVLGVDWVKRESRGNGFRFTMRFKAGRPKSISVPDNYTEGCFIHFKPYIEEWDLYVPDTDQLSFTYVLQPGDRTSSMSLNDTGALVLNGSTIERASTAPSQAADLIMPATQGDGTDGDLKLRGDSGDLVVVDCSPTPEVVNVSTTAFGGEYGAGQRIYFKVMFSGPVIVDGDGSPEMLLETGEEDRAATYYTGNGTSTLTFRYTVQEGDSTDALRPFSSTALTRNGGHVLSALYEHSIDADLRLPQRSGNFSADREVIIIDTSTPEVVSVYTLKENYTYGEGEEIMLHVVYSHAIDVLGNPTIPLNSGGEAVFTYGGRSQTIDISGDDDADFSVVVGEVTAGSFRLQYEGELTDCIRFNSSEGALKALGGLRAFSDRNIESVTVTPRRGGYRFQIDMAEGDGAYERYPSPVEVPWNWYEGCEPFLPINAQPKRAAIETVSFLYQVGSSDMADRLDVDLGGGISFDATSEHLKRSQSQSVTDANTTLPTEPLRVGGSVINVNTSTAYVVGVEGISGNGPFGYNDEVIIRVNFSLPVIALSASSSSAGLLDVPSLAVVVGSTSTAATVTYVTASAVYTSDLMGNLSSISNVTVTTAEGLDTETDKFIYFKYLVAADDESSDLRYLDSFSLTGDIRTSSSNPLASANLLLPAPGMNRSLSYNEDIIINASDQMTFVHNVTRSPESGTLGIGDEVVVSLHFTRKVRYTGGELILELNTGSTTGIPTGVSCSSPAAVFLDSLEFSYVVAPGDASEDLSYFGQGALSLANDTTVVTDVAGQDTNTTLPNPGSTLSMNPPSLGGGKALMVDTSNVVLYVTATNDDGVYYAGASIFIEVVYSNAVIVIGVPMITLRVGDAPYYNRRATYLSGSGTSILIFEYIVQAGDHTINLDYDGTNALYLPTVIAGAAVRSLYDPESDADPTLPAVWSADTLGARKRIIIAGNHIPSVISVSIPGTINGTYGVGEEIDFEVVFTARVFVKDSYTLPYLLVGAGGGRDREAKAAYLQGNMTDTLVFRYLVVEGDEAECFDYLDTRTTMRQRFSSALKRPPAAEIKAASERPETDAILFLPAPGSAGSASSSEGGKKIVLVTERPYVTAVTVSSPDGVYSTGDELSLQAIFSQAVTLVGEDTATPSIELNTGPGGFSGEDAARAVYVSGNNTNTFTFLYTVRFGDFTELLDYHSTDSLILFQTWQQAMERSGAAIQRKATIPTQDADLMLAPPGDPLTVLGRFSIEAMGDQVAIQTGNVRAISVDSPLPDGAYPGGSAIPIVVTFSVEVYVLHGVPSLKMTLDPISYTADSQDISNASLDTATAVYAEANYTSGNGTHHLTFVYSVEDGDSATRLDYASPGSSALWAPFGSIRAVSSLEPVYLKSLPEPGEVGSLGFSRAIEISNDALFVERVWTTTVDGVYGAGQTVFIYVSFVFPVVLDSATAYLSVNAATGGHLVEFFDYSPNNNSLVFAYKILEGHYSDALDITSTGALNGTVRLNASYATSIVNVTLPSPGEPGSLGYSHSVVVDTSDPVVISVSCTRVDGTYSVGAVIDVVVTFSAPVVIYGTFPVAVIALDADGTGGRRNATYMRGNGTTALVFLYEVMDGDGSSDLDLASAYAIGGADIRRMSEAPTTLANLTLPHKGTEGSLAHGSDLVIDTNAFNILAVNSTKDDGLYSVGEEVDIQVYMSGPVIVEGAPILLLNSGPDAFAEFIDSSDSTILNFVYTVGPGDSTGDLSYRGEEALILPEGSSIKVDTLAYFQKPMVLLLDATNGTSSLGSNKDIVIDTSSPYVLDVGSSKLNAEYGAGEEIEIQVTFSAPIIVSDDTVLLVDTGPTTLYAECPYTSGNGTEAVTFMYTVAQGDSSFDLAVYEGSRSEGGRAGVAGTVLRDSSAPIQVVDATLPSLGEDGSLDVNKDIVIDTTAPYVTAIVSLREGLYTVGQQVDMQVIYNKPVNTTGTPRLEFVLDSSNDTLESKYAYFNKFFDTGSFAQAERALSFVYTVEPGDEAVYFKHASSDALELHGNSTIKRTSTNPTTDALINLPAPGAGSLLDVVTKAEIVVRGLYHAHLEDLDITLMHQKHSCTISSGSSSNSSSTVSAGGVGGGLSTRKVQLGIPPNRRVMEGFGPDHGASTGAPRHPSFRHRGVGYDYAFADVVGENLALHEQAVTHQSSTLYKGVSANAADGGTSRFFSDGSTSITNFEVDPWWQITLPTPRNLGHVRLFGREEEVSRRETQLVTLRSKTELAGSFTLVVSDSLGNSRTTSDIYVNAVGALAEESGTDEGTGVGESMESKLETLSIVDSVEVTRSSASSSGAYQRTWTVTFVSPAGDIPAIRLGSDAGLTSFGNEFIFATLQDGTAAGGIYWDGVSHKLNAVLAPSWLMVFNSTEGLDRSMSLEEAKGNASYVTYLSRNDDEINVLMPDGTVGQVLRVQLEGDGYLSISEIELYELQFPPLSRYSGTSPVPSRGEWHPLQSEQSLTAAFQGTEARGQWVLRLRDASAEKENSAVDRVASSHTHGDGGVAGWELVITDFFGNVARHTYNTVATIETVPKYGLLITDGGGGEMKAAKGYERHLGQCHASLNGKCRAGIGAHPSLSSRTMGAVAARNHIAAAGSGTGGGEGGVPAVWYIPEEGYLGPDDFSFSVSTGGVRSAEASVIELHTRRCRLFEEGSRPELCDCENQVISKDKVQQELCFAAISKACAAEDGLGGLGEGNRTDSNSRLTSRVKVRMCKACTVTFHGQLTAEPESYSEYTFECLAEVGKVGKWLMTEGYCVGAEEDGEGSTYSFPVCQNEAFDSVAPVDGPWLGGGGDRVYRLAGEGNMRTDRTDYRRSQDECRCPQQPEDCACRDNAWANRRHGEFN